MLLGNCYPAAAKNASTNMERPSAENGCRKLLDKWAFVSVKTNKQTNSIKK